MTLRIDAHQHCWRLARGDYAWLTLDLGPLYRDFQPADLAPLLRAAGIERTVLVQAAPTDAETDYLLELADTQRFVGAVVGCVDMTRPDVRERLIELARHPRFRGVRPMLQDLPDPRWVLEPTLTPAFEALIELDLTFDALVRPVHLAPLRELMDRHPALRVVIDHGAKPDIASGGFDAWADAMAAIAAETPAYCKLSGLVTEAAPGWTAADIKPYARHILTAFGPARTLWGSDWPVLNLAGDYAGWSALTDALLADMDTDARAAVRGGTAACFYGIE
jgi:L-fuconolactonase